MTGNHIDLTSVLHALSVEQLQRLDVALSAAQGGTVDLYALVAGMLATPAPLLPGSPEWRSETDGGRAYELLLDGGDPAVAQVRHEQEWARANSLVATGLTYQSAWEQIRFEALLSDVTDPFPTTRERQGTCYRKRPVPPPRDRRKNMQVRISPKDRDDGPERD